MSGVFVTFEGPEGAGKSTQIQMLARRLEAQNVPHVLTREPGGTVVADRLRGLLAESADGSIDARTELLIVLAARSHHVEHVIRPALAENKLVVCDRYTDSTICYQGAGRGIDVGEINLLNNFATGGLEPDITFLVHVDPSVGLKRLSESGRKLDRFEREAEDFHRRVSNAYRELVASAPERVVPVDGTQPQEQIAEEIYGKLWSAYPQMPVKGN